MEQSYSYRIRVWYIYLFKQSTKSHGSKVVHVDVDRIQIRSIDFLPLRDHGFLWINHCIIAADESVGWTRGFRHFGFSRKEILQMSGSYLILGCLFSRPCFIFDCCCFFSQFWRGHESPRNIKQKEPFYLIHILFGRC